MKTKIISLVLCFTIFAYGTFMVNVPKTKAWPVSITAANMVPETLGDTGTWSQLGSQIGKWALDALSAVAIVGMQVAALMVEQKAMQAIMGGPKGDTVIHDYNQYLYTSPNQTALSQMDKWFNTVTKGRASSSNYEGVGTNYYNYLVTQARKAIGGQNMETTIQNQAIPSQAFASGNMKWITSYMQCANMVACFTLTAQSKYNQEIDKAQNIAKSMDVNGFLPRIVNGRITQPAVMASKALGDIDKLGTEMIMKADPTGDKQAAAMQIAKGVAVSMAARTANYYISDDKGKEMQKNKNDQFPFSLSYNTADGTSLSSGGFQANTGIGANPPSWKTACLTSCRNAGNNDTECAASCNVK